VTTSRGRFPLFLLPKFSKKQREVLVDQDWKKERPEQKKTAKRSTKKTSTYHKRAEGKKSQKFSSKVLKKIRLH